MANGNDDDETVHVVHHVVQGMSGARRDTSNELASLVGAAAGLATRSPLVGVSTTAAAKVALRFSGLDDVFDTDKDDR
jgi:hypothetical protein